MSIQRKLSLLSMIISITACTASSVETVHDSVSAIPKIQSNSLTKIRQCVVDELGDFVNEKYKSFGYVFMVDNVADGTIPESYTDGPLADSGRLQMINSLQRLFPENTKQVILAGKIPSVFKEADHIKEGFLNELGLPHYDSITNLQNSFINVFNTSRVEDYAKHYHDQIDKVKNVRFYVIDAAFSRNDSDTTYVNGAGFSTEYSRKTQSELSIGSNKSKKIITLTFNVIDPLNNIVIASENFDLEFTNNKQEGEFKIGRNGISTGISIEKQVIESVHSAQQTLIDYASIWLIKKITDKDISKCITF